MKQQQPYHFYSHLVKIDFLQEQLAQLSITENQQIELLTIIQSNFHYAVLDSILSHLNTTDKQTFLGHMQTNNHQKTWHFLEGKIENIEQEINNTIAEIQEEIQKDINEIR